MEDLFLFGCSWSPEVFHRAKTGWFLGPGHPKRSSAERALGNVTAFADVRTSPSTIVNLKSSSFDRITTYIQRPSPHASADCVCQLVLLSVLCHPNINQYEFILTVIKE